MRFTVSVPATSANLGCGFDVFGLALSLYTDFTFETETTNTGTNSVDLEVEGEGAETLASEKCGLVYEAIQFYAETQNVKLPAFKLIVKNRIPLGRGLGSSAAAIVGGLVGASILSKGHQWQEERNLLLTLATHIEGHPDNVAPALCGGLVVAVIASEQSFSVINNRDEKNFRQPLVIPLKVPKNLETVLFVPDFEMSTKAARAVLPASIPFADAVHNMGRTGLFAAIFASSDPPLEFLAEAMADKLHQPYRTQIFPQLPGLIDTAQRAGAYGAALSGAGSSIITLTDSAKVAEVEDALTRMAETLQLPGRAIKLEIASEGTQATIVS